VIDVSGALDAKGIASQRPVRGRILGRGLGSRYELELEDDDGRACRLVGERRPRLADPFFSSSTLRAELTDEEGHLLAKLVLRFDYRRELWRFLPS